MNELESINKIDFSTENIPKIFDSQRKNIKQDILFLKEDILKDFREIENKLNTKYEKQNSNTLTKLHKFENTIEAMNNKIFELSTLISTDKNIQNKVANLQDFREKISDKLITQEITIKTNESIMKDAINRYDRILTDSVIYQGLIGPNGRFQTFHQLIDYLLLSITQFINFRDKNMIDFKGYKAKLESLFKSLKAQTDSIITSTNKYTNKKVLDSEKRIKDLINANESKIYDIKLENNKFNSYIEGKLDEKYNEIKRLLDIRADLYSKIEEEIDLLKDFNKGVSIKFENSENEINFMKDKFKTFTESIEEMQLNSKKDPNVIDFIKNAKIKNNIINNSKFFNINSSYNINSSNHNRFGRRGTLAKSIIKQYITGEIGLNELENPIKRQKSTLINENDINKIINNNNKYKTNYSLDNISRGKRLTLSPDKFRSILDKNLLNKFMEINSEKTMLDKSNNSISEEKSEDNENIYSFRDNNSNENRINNDKNNNLLNEEINNEEDKKNDFSLNKDKNKEEDNIILLKNENKTEINSSVQTEIINIKKSKEDNNDKEKVNNNNYFINENNDYHSINSKGSFISISYDKKILENNKNSKKVGKNKKRINNQKQISAVGKLCQIGGVQDIINYSKSNSNRLNKTSIIFYDNKNNNDNNTKYYYYNIKKRSRKNKLNIIEVNFEKPKDSIKEENELRNIIQKIKENRVNFFSERNNRPLDKNKTFKRFQVSESDLGFENRSLNGLHLSNNLKSPNFYKKMNNDEFGKYSSFGYLNYIKNNKKIVNMRKMNLSKKKEISGNFSS